MPPFDLATKTQYNMLDNSVQTLSLASAVSATQESLKQQVTVKQLQIIISSASDTSTTSDSEDDSDADTTSWSEETWEPEPALVPESPLDSPDISKIDVFDDVTFKKRALLLCVKWEASSCWLDAMCALFGLCMASQQYPRWSEIAVSRFLASMRRGSFAAGAYVALVDFATSWIALAVRNREFYTNIRRFDSATILLSRARWAVRDALRPMAEQHGLVNDGIPDDSAQDTQTFLYGIFDYLPHITGGKMRLVEGCGRTGCAREIEGQSFTFAHQNVDRTSDILHIAGSLEEAINSALIQQITENTSTCPCKQGTTTSRYYEVSELPELLFLSTVDMETSTWNSTPRSVGVQYMSDHNSTESAKYSWAGSLCADDVHMRLYWRSGKDNEIIEYDSQKSPWMKLVTCSEGTDLDNKLLPKWRQHVTFQVLVRKGGSCVEVSDICQMNEDIWMNDLGQHEEGFGTFTNRVASPRKTLKPTADIDDW